MICNKCGNAVEHNAYFCDKCGNQVRKETVPIDKSQLKGMALWEENYLFGTLGALLGSAAGVLIFIQWYRIFGTQFLAPVPGLILGLLTAGGYWWLAKRIKGVGTAICTGLVLLAGWTANHYFWALVVYSHGISGKFTYLNVFFNLGRYLDAGDIGLPAYIMGLISIYFGALVGVAVIRAAHKTIVKE